MATTAEARRALVAASAGWYNAERLADVRKAEAAFEAAMDDLERAVREETQPTEPSPELAEAIALLGDLNVCVVCGGILALLPDEPPHCEDCSLSDGDVEDNGWHRQLSEWRAMIERIEARTRAKRKGTKR